MFSPGSSPPPPAAQGRPCFALLDDAGATDARSRLLTGYVGTLACADAAQLPGFLDSMQQELAQGRHALALFDYELGAQLHGITPRPGAPGVALVLLFEDCRKLTANEVAHWLAQQEAAAVGEAGEVGAGGAGGDQAVAGIAGLLPSVNEQQFHDAIGRIHRYLEAGDTYQVNYTYRLRFDAYGPALTLYRRLRASQPVPYGALIALPDGRSVLSFSPELFVRNDNGELTARPMKGTAAASGDAAQDAARAQALATDPKNRAENLMIVDLLRNDLGRIAQPGSVRVPQLFEVSRYGEVLQMTSTVRARARAEVTLAQLLAALYPCGSITGAPKRRTMQIIRELEPDARGLYTGAIGWFETPAEGQGFGDFCLSVPIRTLVLQAPQGGVRAGEMGVGAGIVHDSQADQEYAECLLKAHFLTGLRQDFELLETMQASAAGCPYLERHLQRLRASARYFGFAWDEPALREQVRQAFAQLAPGPHRLRLALSQDGRASIQTAPLTPLAEPVKVLLAAQAMRSDDLFLRHKTTLRQTYDAAWKQAEAQGAFDMLFHNEAGELTEGARSSLFIKLHGRWLTPPVTAGLLPGVMRAVLLDDPAWQAAEARITLADLRAAEEIVVCNALRGALRATLSASI
ncbi:chorismate-binding protein [Noviherbaspirillum sedimenti]|uniref:Aminodeoxychorismate synthase component I n=1 Tax=Noviherbaspirillum sedimenti TaxID=2320865 RepID=A0A3A3G651_9BURK|nr:bifunctional anthranilate synthase component I family protein/class IV aminotransferase [Noviherbaspirillum sedimenti]RJG03145.1 aminodeoxychorismate synthase component I [Noviherbaspirillum sedimenti]